MTDLALMAPLGEKEKSWEKAGGFTLESFLRELPIKAQALIRIRLNCAFLARLES